MKTSLKLALLTTVIGTFLCTACGFRIGSKVTTRGTYDCTVDGALNAVWFVMRGKKLATDLRA